MICTAGADDADPQPVSLTVQLLLFGIAIGSRVAIGTIGFALLSGTSRFFDFTWAGSYVLAGYCFYVFLERVPLGLAVPCTLVVAAVIGIAINLGLYRPLRRRHASGRLILLAGIGATTVISNGVALAFGTTPKRVFDPLLSGTVALGDYVLTVADVAAVVTLLAVIVALSLFLRFTRSGAAIRAVTENPTMAQVIGIDKERTISVAYAIGAATLALSAALDAMSGSITPQTGLLALFNVAIPAIVGGLTNIRAVALAGLLYGIITNLVIEWIPTQWQTPFTFAVFGLLLLAKPWGFAGNRLAAVEI